MYFLTSLPGQLHPEIMKKIRSRFKKVTLLAASMTQGEQELTARWRNNSAYYCDVINKNQRCYPSLSNCKNVCCFALNPVYKKTFLALLQLKKIIWIKLFA